MCGAQGEMTFHPGWGTGAWGHTVRFPGIVPGQGGDTGYTQLSQRECVSFLLWTLAPSSVKWNRQGLEKMSSDTLSSSVILQVHYILSSRCLWLAAQTEVGSFYLFSYQDFHSSLFSGTR